MIHYPSIETVYKRNGDTNRLNFSLVREPEASLVNCWNITEKIDGMNIRVIVKPTGVLVYGRTDKAVIPGDLLATLKEMFDHERLMFYFTSGGTKSLDEEWVCTFYGEGYGAGIQKGGAYRKDKAFRCFDVRFGNEGRFGWTTPDAMYGICNALTIPTVPLLGQIAAIPASEHEAWDVLQALAPYSFVAFGDRGVMDVPAEGIVAKPPTVLYNHYGDRVQWKLTYREFHPESLAA